MLHLFGLFGIGAPSYKALVRRVCPLDQLEQA